MKVLIIGSGLKEAALIWKLRASEKYSGIEVLLAPGNQALAEHAEILDCELNDPNRLLEIAIARNIHLTIVGEAELFTKGIVDLFRENGKLILGPTKAAAMLEASNLFARDFAYRNEIPSPRFVCFENKVVAEAFLERASFPIRICADQEFETNTPARVACDVVEAQKLIQTMFKNRFLQRTSSKVIFEEVIEGPRITINTICDGERALSLLPVQTYRETNENDGYQDRGAYAPTPVRTTELMKEIRATILDPSIKALAEDGCAYTGILAFDIVLDERDHNKPKLIKYRTCLADSDAQVILPLLDEDLFELITASASEDLGFYKEGLHKYLGSALAVNVIAADAVLGFGQNLAAIDAMRSEQKNLEENFSGLPLLFYGLAAANNGSQGNQTEVFGATAVAENLLDAQILAYKLADKISLPSKYFETNIGDAGMIV